MAIAILVGVLIPRTSFAQSSNDEGKADPQFYTNVNGGFGLLYGGFGGNVEAGMGHLAGFGALGYATERTIDTTTIASSINYHFGVRYYFDVGSDQFFPRVGIGYGWIANYYNADLNLKDYEQSAKGLSLHLGAQFFTVEGLVFNFDVAMASNYSLIQADRHPDFFPFYLRPCIGIGYEITTLFDKDDGRKKIRNKEIDPFGS